jgi:hypothetical protein
LPDLTSGDSILEDLFSDDRASGDLASEGLAENSWRALSAVRMSEVSLLISSSSLLIASSRCPGGLLK